MNILSLLTKEKRVAGIEISDSVVRIAFFRPHTKKIGLTKKTAAANEVAGEDELILIEEPIAANIIADGVVVDVDLLAKTLKSIWTKASLGTDYAIVAIPDDKIYSRVFSFPKSVDDARLTEAMRLAISFQIPMKTEDIYLDWERTAGTGTSNEILLSTVPQKVAQGYVEALERAGIKIIALESHLASIARSVKLVPGETTLFSKKTPDGATIFALRDGILRFSRTLPLRFVPEAQIISETRNVRNALAVGSKGPVVEQDILTATVRNEYASHGEISEPKSKWLVALGAAIRAKIPEGEDNLVSLLPVGTEEAYAYQRATTFIVLLRNLTIGVSLFFIVAHLTAYAFIVSLSQGTADQITTLSAQAIPQDLVDMEKKVADINTITETGAVLLSQLPIWSNVLTEIVSRTPEGITISMFSAPNITERYTLAGVATSRIVLNNYKKILQEAPIFLEVEIPLTNLEKEGEIPFTASFRLKDPSSVYFSSQPH